MEHTRDWDAFSSSDVEVGLTSWAQMENAVEMGGACGNYGFIKVKTQRFSFLWFWTFFVFNWTWKDKCNCLQSAQFAGSLWVFQLKIPLWINRSWGILHVIEIHFLSYAVWNIATYHMKTLHTYQVCMDILLMVNATDVGNLVIRMWSLFLLHLQQHQVKAAKVGCREIKDRVFMICDMKLLWF